MGPPHPQQYLDDRNDLKGTRLKLLCRTGALPVMRRLGREQRPPWPLERRRCYACHTGAVESVPHFLCECRAYAGHRRRLVNTVRRALDGGACTVRGDEFAHMDNTGRCRLLLGQRLGDPVAEDQVDKAVKHYLKKAWNARGRVAEAIDSVLGTSSAIFAAPVC